MSDEFNFQAWQHSELASALAIARAADERCQKIREETRLACQHEIVAQHIDPPSGALYRICLICGAFSKVWDHQLEDGKGLFRRNVLILLGSEFVAVADSFDLPREKVRL